MNYELVHKVQKRDLPPLYFEDVMRAFQRYLLLSAKSDEVTLSKVAVRIDKKTGAMEEIQ